MLIDPCFFMSQVVESLFDRKADDMANRFESDPEGLEKFLDAYVGTKMKATFSIRKTSFEVSMTPSVVRSFCSALATLSLKNFTGPIKQQYHREQHHRQDQINRLTLRSAKPRPHE